MVEPDDVQVTRRDDSGRHASEPAVGETRREARWSVSGTRRESRLGGKHEANPPPVDETRRESDPAPDRRAAYGLIALPTALRATFTIVRELPNPGTEADSVGGRRWRRRSLCGEDLPGGGARRRLRLEQTRWARLDSHREDLGHGRVPTDVTTRSWSMCRRATSPGSSNADLAWRPTWWPRSSPRSPTRWSPSTTSRSFTAT